MFMSPKFISVAYSFFKALCSAFAIFGILQLSTLTSAFAQGLSSAGPMIFETRRSLPLDPSEPVYHDFYINAGPEAGFKKGQYMTVVRYVPVHDPIQNKQQGELPVNIARIQVIQVSTAITVARLVSEFTDEERPTLEYESIMVGDRIDPQSMTMEAPKRKAKAQKEAVVEKPTVHEPESTVVVVTNTQAATPVTAPVMEAPKSATPAATAPAMVRVPVPAVPENKALEDKQIPAASSEAASDSNQTAQKL